MSQRQPCICQDCGERFDAYVTARFCRSCRYKPSNRRGGKKKKYEWTPERDQILREEYDGTIKGRAAEIGQRLGFPGWVVRKRASLLGLTRPADRREWTEQETAFLGDHAGTRTVRWIAKRLERSDASVVLKLKRLGISRAIRDGTYTLRELEECFGVDHHSIDRWIARGLLKGSRRGTDRPNDTWSFTDEQILAFIIENPTTFDLRKVDQLWFMDLLTSPEARRSIVRAA
ncbi:MAG: hypothetical protein KY432_07370 [Acidobacteria bacterium]|nr:hypothetical protein [Acidobacteriota bacterium]